MASIASSIYSLRSNSDSTKHMPSWQKYKNRKDQLHSNALDLVRDKENIIPNPYVYENPYSVPLEDISVTRLLHVSRKLLEQDWEELPEFMLLGFHKLRNKLEMVCMEKDVNIQLSQLISCMTAYLSSSKRCLGKVTSHRTRRRVQDNLKGCFRFINDAKSIVGVDQPVLHDIGFAYELCLEVINVTTDDNTLGKLEETRQDLGVLLSKGKVKSANLMRLEKQVSHFFGSAMEEFEANQFEISKAFNGFALDLKEEQFCSAGFRRYLEKVSHQMVLVRNEKERTRTKVLSAIKKGLPYCIESEGTLRGVIKMADSLKRDDIKDPGEMDRFFDRAQKEIQRARETYQLLDSLVEMITIQLGVWTMSLCEIMAGPDLAEGKDTMSEIKKIYETTKELNKRALLPMGIQNTRAFQRFFQ